MIVNVEQSSFSGVVLNVSRLVGIKEINGSKVFSKWRFNNTFDDFGYQRKIINRTIVRDWKTRFFKQRRYCRLLESGMELARAKRQIDYVNDSGNKY